MAGLGNIFEMFGHPLAKWLAVAFALRAVWTLVAWRRCAALLGSGEIPPPEALEMIEQRRQALWRHNGRFALIVTAGLALAIYGLLKLAYAGADAPHALVMLVAGLYLFLSEPIRRQIQDVEDRLALAAGRGDLEGQEMARAMLNGNQVNLVLIDVGAALGLGAAVLALSGGVPMM